MKNINLLLSFTFILIISIPSPVFSQSVSWVKQVISVNSGKFEYSPPYLDFVTIQTYNPFDKSIKGFDTIFTQSAQDILIHGSFAYVAAQDSLIKYNLNTYKRVAAIADSGLNKLWIYSDRLIVSKQYPVNTFFVEVLDTANLSLISEIGNISGDCGGIVVTNDSVYVAVNGGWLGTEGKIAVLDPSSWTLTREINLGVNAIGINNLYLDEDKIYSINKTPYGLTTGSISVYDTATGTFVNKLVNFIVGNGVGIKNHMLYAIFNEGIGSFDLPSMQIVDTTIIQDPGSALFTYILSSAVDTVSNLFYINIGDYMTNGYCLVASLNGDSVTSFHTGISTETIGIDYRVYPAGVNERKNVLSILSLYPNPTSDKITIHYNGEEDVHEVMITDVYGEVIKPSKYNLKKYEELTISVADLPSGMYCLVLKTDGDPVISKFIRR